MFDHTVVVYGGNGALGSTLVNEFKKSGTIRCISIGLRENDAADETIVITETDDWTLQSDQVHKQMKEIIKEDQKVDAIFCVAGGWAGGNANAKSYIKNCDLMWRQSVWSSSIAGGLAAKFLKPGGVLVLSGAAPCTEGTSGMMGYGMAKAAVHQLTKSLAQEKSGLPCDSSVLCILPATLDTPNNRKWMSKADFSTWTSMTFVADLFRSWMLDVKKRPTSGSLVKLVTVEDQTTVEVV